MGISPSMRKGLCSDGCRSRRVMEKPSTPGSMISSTTKSGAPPLTAWTRLADRSRLRRRRTLPAPDSAAPLHGWCARRRRPGSCACETCAYCNADFAVAVESGAPPQGNRFKSFAKLHSDSVPPRIRAMTLRVGGAEAWSRLRVAMRNCVRGLCRLLTADAQSRRARFPAMTRASAVTAMAMLSHPVVTCVSHGKLFCDTGASSGGGIFSW